MDFLGLTTLTIIEDALKLIDETSRRENRYRRAPARRQKNLRDWCFTKACTSGIFQFESPGMRDILRRYQPIAIGGSSAR